MARSSLAKNSPYFGVFRVGEHHGIRIQYRVSSKGPTMAEERKLGPGGLFDADTLVFVKLSVSREGHRARAWGSVDGHDWTELGRYQFAEPLRYQGIGVSSHGVARGAKFLFGVPRNRPRPGFNHTRFIGKRDSAAPGMGRLGRKATLEGKPLRRLRAFAYLPDYTQPSESTGMLLWCRRSRSVGSWPNVGRVVPRIGTAQSSVSRQPQQVLGAQAMRGSWLALLVTVLSPAVGLSGQALNDPLVRVMGFGDFNYLVTELDRQEGLRMGQMVGHVIADIDEGFTFFGEVSVTGKDNRLFDRGRAGPGSIRFHRCPQDLCGSVPHAGRVLEHGVPPWVLAPDLGGAARDGQVREPLYPDPLRGPHRRRWNTGLPAGARL